MSFNPVSKAINILMETTKEGFNFGNDYYELKTILEDANSPRTVKYKEKLYQSVLDKAHVDFGNIPDSKGNIKAYVGYAPMVETLEVIIGLSKDQKSNAHTYAETVMESIKHIESLASAYAMGFTAKSEYVMLEYNTYVYTCVQATTTLISDFVEYIKRPDKAVYTIALKNTKLRANLFYFDQLTAFNNVNRNMQANYRKMLESMASKGRNNFTGVEEMVGMATVGVVALAIIPITRELIYHFYNLRADISKELDMQVKFLEMNRACVESNDAFTEEKRSKILAKQESLRNALSRLSDVIRVKEAKASKSTQKDLSRDNSLLTTNSLHDEVSSSPFQIL